MMGTPLSKYSATLRELADKIDAGIVRLDEWTIDADMVEDYRGMAPTGFRTITVRYYDSGESFAPAPNCCSTCHHYTPNPDHEDGLCWMLLYGCNKLPQVVTWETIGTVHSFQARVHPEFGCRMWRKKE